MESFSGRTTCGHNDILKEGGREGERGVVISSVLKMNTVAKAVLPTTTTTVTLKTKRVIKQCNVCMCVCHSQQKVPKAHKRWRH